MERGNTKEQILDAALDLFSVKGFEATSISMLADAVGIRKSSLYSHFASKQEILDSLISQILEEYNAHSLFANARWDDPVFLSRMDGLTTETAAQMITGQIRYVLHDPKVSKARKMLAIEQFQNAELSELYNKQSYEDIMEYHRGMMEFLIDGGILQDKDPQIMAAQYAMPISMWLALCDRDPGREEEVVELIKRHTEQFFSMYKK